MADPFQQRAALEFMKGAAREAFAVCARTAEEMAANIEKGDLPMDGVTACRLLASMFKASAGRD